MTAEEYILNNSFVVYYPAAKCTRVVIDYKALQALNMARKDERSKCLRDLQRIEMEIKNNASDAFCIASGCEKFIPHGINKDPCPSITCKKMEIFSKMIRDYKIKFETK
jgi:hypothetical protein